MSDVISRMRKRPPLWVGREYSADIYMRLVELGLARYQTMVATKAHAMHMLAAKSKPPAT